MSWFKAQKLSSEALKEVFIESLSISGFVNEVPESKLDFRNIAHYWKTEECVAVKVEKISKNNENIIQSSLMRMLQKLFLKKIMWLHLNFLVKKIDD